MCKVEDIELLFKDSEDDEDVKEEKDRLQRRMYLEEEEEEDEREEDGSGENKESEENAEEVMDQIALVPLRSLPGSDPTLPTSTRATLCPVEV